jgi:hypothetical protein
MRRILLAVGLVAMPVVMLPTMALAQATEPISSDAITAPDAIIISAPLLMIVVGLIIPFVNGLLTRITVPSQVKWIITLALSTIAGFLATATTSEGIAVFSMTSVYTTLYAFVIAVLTYTGFYKKVGLTSSVPNGKLGANTGILGRDPNA